MNAISALSTAELAQRCTEETEKFFRQVANDPQFCFELMRRALAEQVADAFTYVYQIYEPHVINWVHRHNRFALTGESAEFFAGAAFRAFYFGLRGPKFERFESLGAVLSYLKACVHTAIAQYLRDEERGHQVPLDETNEPPQVPDLGSRVEAAELWAHICRLLPDERDQLLARCAFVLGLKPREICAAYRSQWSSERDVSVALYRIRRILRSDPEVAALAGRARDGEAGSGRTTPNGD